MMCFVPGQLVGTYGGEEGKKYFCFFFLSRTEEKIEKKKSIEKKPSVANFDEMLKIRFFDAFIFFAHLGARSTWNGTNIVRAVEGRDDIGFVYIYPRVVGR